MSRGDSFRKGGRLLETKSCGGNSLETESRGGNSRKLKTSKCDCNLICIFQFCGELFLVDEL